MVDFYGFHVGKYTSPMDHEISPILEGVKINKKCLKPNNLVVCLRQRNDRSANSWIFLMNVVPDSKTSPKKTGQNKTQSQKLPSALNPRVMFFQDHPKKNRGKQKLFITKHFATAWNSLSFSARKLPVCIWFTKLSYLFFRFKRRIIPLGIWVKVGSFLNTANHDSMKVKNLLLMGRNPAWVHQLRGLVVEIPLFIGGENTFQVVGCLGFLPSTKNVSL